MSSFRQPSIVSRVMVLLLTSTLVVFAYQRMVESRAETAGEGSLEGHVIDALTGNAVPRAVVTLTCTGTREYTISVGADASGRFAFGSLSSGSCLVVGERSGYQRTFYGSRRDPGRGVPLATSPGQAIRELTLKLIPSATIAGRVGDQNGDPMPMIAVTVLGSAYAHGKRRWMQVGGTHTDDRGNFRVTGLKAGSYIVSVSDVNRGTGLVRTTQERSPETANTAYASTYYGGVDVTRATAIDLRTGEERRGIDISMVEVRTVRVRGRVVGATADGFLSLLLIRRGSQLTASSTVAAGAVNQRDQTFEFTTVVPGAYFIIATDALGGMATIGFSVPLEVADKDIEGVEVRREATNDIAGRVVFAGHLARPKNVSVDIDVLDFGLPRAGPHAAVGQDGSFTLKNVVRGKCRIRVGGLLDDSYLKSVKFNGEDIDEDSAELLGGGGHMEIVVSAAGAQVAGTVLGEDARPIAGAFVSMIPDSRHESDYRTAYTEPDGTFVLKGMRPGTYKILAWDDIEPGAYLDPEFLKPFESRAQIVVLDENGRANVTVKSVLFETAAQLAAAH